MKKANFWKTIVLLAALLGVFTSVTVALAEKDDSAVPVFRFINPQAGQTVSGETEIVVFVPPTISNRRLSGQRVYLGIDGVNWSQMRLEGPGLYRVKWDTQRYENGKHQLTAVLFQPGPETAQRTIQIEVVVNNRGAAFQENSFQVN